MSAAATLLRFGWRRRVPLVLQTEASECGLACIAMIAAFHGRPVALGTLRERCRSSGNGMNLEQLMKLARASGLNPRAIRIELDQLNRVAAPCILHWDMNHFVVLERGGARTATLHDPALGVRKMPWDEVSKHFTGIALTLTPSVGFATQAQRPRVTLRSVTGPIVGLKRSLLQILVLGGALEVIGLASPVFLQWIADSGTTSGNIEAMSYMTVGLCLLIVLQQIIAAVRAWAVVCLGASLNFQWLGNVFGHLLRLPMNFFARRFLADVVSRFHSVSTIQATLTTTFVESVLDGALSAITFAAMLSYSVTLAGISLIAVGGYAVVRVAAFRPARIAVTEQLAHDAKQQGHFLETVRGARTIKLYNRENERRDQWLNLLASQINADISVQRIVLVQRICNGLVFGLEKVVLVWLAARHVIDGTLTLGMMFAFLAFETQFSARIGALVDKAVEIFMLGLHAERLSDITAAKPEEEPAEPASDAGDSLDATIEFKDVSFRYGDDDPDVLCGVNLRVENGDFVAITGPSGCGKTTLMKAALGILEGVRGDVCVGGVSLNRLSRSVMRDMIATVMQDDHLFAGSIGDNISFFAAEPDHAWIRRCAEMASVHDDVMGLPMGYGTLIGDMGAALSGGQQQRVLLARALYKRPRILLLDEASSHLDTDRERAVNKAISELRITRLIIAHRAETIAAATRILRFEQGRLTEDSGNASVLGRAA